MALKRLSQKGRSTVFMEKFSTESKFLKRVNELEKEGITPKKWKQPSKKGHSVIEWCLCYNRINH